MKLGHITDRAACAAFAREQRNRFHSLQGNWTRRLWNYSVAQAVHNRLAMLTRARKAGK
jgi:hypothetical protein